MNRLLILLALGVTTAALASQAFAQVLRCVGPGGRIEFASVCPPGTKAEPTGIRNNPGAVAATPEKSVAERGADFRKRQAEQQEAAKKADEKARDAADRSANCESAQAYLKSLQSGVRIVRTDPKTGERVFLDDADRQHEIQRAQRGVDSNCN
ncbi:MAG: DUF4124 domain-containing protein [Betaproteobacteria bacterium]|jgi:hypothetical protein|nr:DUF4124 domain-containing protein [Betaproteobacteria bacterium]